MKNVITVLLAALVAALLAGCGESAPAPAFATGERPLQIVATIFPEYDWVRNILGENPAGVEVTALTASGVDLHSYQPTVEDMLKIADCDIFIYVGGESDDWVEDALQEVTNPNRTVVNLLEELGDAAKEEEIAEGMQADEHDAELDEHVWLSLKNAAALVDVICDAISAKDPAHAQVYVDNAAAYKEKLAALDAAYQKTVEEAPVRTLLFGDRFPFRYLVEDYGLQYYAAFVGCSAETEASFETVTFLAGKVDELDLHTVLTIEGTQHRIAETVVQSTRKKDQQVLTLDSMQAITQKEIEDGVTYLSIMEKNLDVLKQALS